MKHLTDKEIEAIVLESFDTSDSTNDFDEIVVAASRAVKKALKPHGGVPWTWKPSTLKRSRANRAADHGRNRNSIAPIGTKI
jgi:hypothetical protein